MTETAKDRWGCLVSIIITIGLILGSLFFIIRPDKMCGTHSMHECLSPNKQLKAIIFSVDCGATTGYSTQISVVSSDFNLDSSDRGNVFIADDNDGKSKTNGEIIDLDVKWIDDNNLIIEYDRNARIFKKKSSNKNVNIRYILK